MKNPAVIYTDGGSRGNPGPSGAGAVIMKDGESVFQLSEYLGEGTNNQAEYTALVMALKKALELGFNQVEVRMDSELIVRQMTGSYRVKNQGLMPLFLEARRLAAQFGCFSIVHVRRELNQEADRLANQAMDSAKRPSAKRWTGPMTEDCG